MKDEKSNKPKIRSIKNKEKSKSKSKERSKSNPKRKLYSYADAYYQSRNTLNQEKLNLFLQNMYKSRNNNPLVKSQTISIITVPANAEKAAIYKDEVNSLKKSNSQKNQVFAGKDNISYNSFYLKTSEPNQDSKRDDNSKNLFKNIEIMSKFRSKTPLVLDNLKCEHFDIGVSPITSNNNKGLLNTDIYNDITPFMKKLIPSSSLCNISKKDDTLSRNTINKEYNENVIGHDNVYVKSKPPLSRKFSSIYKRLKDITRDNSVKKKTKDETDNFKATLRHKGEEVFLRNTHNDVAKNTRNNATTSLSINKNQGFTITSQNKENNFTLITNKSKDFLSNHKESEVMAKIRMMTPNLQSNIELEEYNDFKSTNTQSSITRMKIDSITKSINNFFQQKSVPQTVFGSPLITMKSKKTEKDTFDNFATKEFKLRRNLDFIDFNENQTIKSNILKDMKGLTRITRTSQVKTEETGSKIMNSKL